MPATGFISDERVWYEVWLDTPLSRAKNSGPNDPGTNVMSRKREAKHPHFPERYGIISAYNPLPLPGLVTVLGKTSPGSSDPVAASGRFIWRGTVTEYVKVWEVD